MATMNIKDPRVHELATELARLRGSSATAAVRSALEEALAAELHRRADRTSSLRELQAQAAATCHLWADDEDLYAEAGLPR